MPPMTATHATINRVCRSTRSSPRRAPTPAALTHHHRTLEPSRPLASNAHAHLASPTPRNHPLRHDVNTTQPPAVPARTAPALPRVSALSVPLLRLFCHHSCPSSTTRSTVHPPLHQQHSPVPGPDPARLPLWWLGGVRARHRPQTPMNTGIRCGHAIHTPVHTIIHATLPVGERLRPSRTRGAIRLAPVRETATVAFLEAPIPALPHQRTTRPPWQVLHASRPLARHTAALTRRYTPAGADRPRRPPRRPTGGAPAGQFRQRYDFASARLLDAFQRTFVGAWDGRLVAR